MEDKGILIVDDNKDFRDMVKVMLSREELFRRYYEAGNGAEAMELLKRGDGVDMVLMDLFMPAVGGIDVIAWARAEEKYADLPILVLSVDGRGEAKAKGLNLGASDYVVKPFDKVELVARIKLLLKRKEVQDDLMSKNAELERINEALKRLAVVDDLTKLYNRLYFLECLSQEMKRCIRYKMEMTLMFIDLDGFKAVNDTYGHLAGDQVLRDVSAILRESVRDSDAVGRYGGDEFVLYLVHTGLKGAAVPAERIRAKIEKRVFTFPNGTYRATASIGMAAFPGRQPESRDEFIHRADLANYQAKMTGKNRVVASEW